jgi:hypothetical protein
LMTRGVIYDRHMFKIQTTGLVLYLSVWPGMLYQHHFLRNLRVGSNS